MTENDFELLCKDGSRRPVGEYHNCNWGKVTSDAIVSSSAKSSDVRKKYQAFLQVCILLPRRIILFNLISCICIIYLVFHRLPPDYTRL